MKYPAHFARVVLVFAVISLCSLSLAGIWLTGSWHRAC